MKRTYTVAGTWPFPLDMLRRDNAQPATPEDQDLIDRMSGEASDDELGTRTAVSVTLIMEAGDPIPSRPGGRYLPNADRWESFGWSVTGGDADVVRDLETREWHKAEEERQKAQAGLRQSALAKLTPEERDALGL